MAPFRLSRRAVLRGLGGVTVALPALEIMLDGPPARAQSAAVPKRYLVCFGGQSLGGDEDPLHNDLVPNKVGAGYDLKSALAPFGDFNVQNEISVISGLQIPTASQNGGTPPAGGRTDDFHVNSLSPLLSGVRSLGNTSARGATSDQIVAGAIAGNTPFKSLVYRAQAEWYLSVSAPYGRDMISYNLDGSGNPQAIPPTISPKQAFDSLFGNFTGGLTPDQIAQLQFQTQSRRSVLDLVSGGSSKLLARVGKADKTRLQRHFDEIRALETQIASLPPAAAGSCQKPMDPGADPALGGAQGTDGSGNNTYSQNQGYSGEEQRLRAFCDLIHMGFACDLSRVASLQMTMFQSHMNMYALTGQATDLHEISHGGVSGGTMAVSKAIAWHMKHFSYLVAKFRDTPEGNGNMLDNTAMVFLWEGGHGNDPSSGKTSSAHSTENMACLTAGHAGGLHPGLHIPAPGMHPANVLVTAMNAAGVTTSALGEVSGEIPGLRG